MEFYTAAGIYINCKLYPFIVWILSGWKLYETRTRRVLHPLIGQRVFLIETGHGRPMIIGSAKITEAEQVPYTYVSKRRLAQITGTTYDIKPGGAKWFYKLEDVERLPEPIPAPDTCENHGRSYCTWDAYRTRKILQSARKQSTIRTPQKRRMNHMAQTKEERVQRGIEYRKHHVRQVKFDFSIEYDADILAHLDAQKNRQGYIKDLIRADIARAKSEPTQPAQNILKEDKTMKYNPVNEPSSLFFDHDPARVIIRGDQPAQNPDDPGVPSGGNPWYAVQTDPTDDWSTGSFDLDEAKSMARNLRKDHPDALIAVIDNALENPFCVDEIRDF